MSRHRTEPREPSLEEAPPEQLVVANAKGLVRHFDLSPDQGVSVGAAVKDLVHHFAGPEGEGYGGQDMVVWHGGRLAAVVRRGLDGRPQYTIFEDPTWL